QHFGSSCLPLQRFAQRLLTSFPRRHVADGTDEPGRSTGFIEDWHGAILDPAIGAIGMPYTVFAIEPSARPFQAIAHRAPIEREVLRMDQFVPVRCLKLAAFKPENFD